MDCRLCCLDGAVLCSKLVLAAHSPLLADILRSSEASTGILITGKLICARSSKLSPQFQQFRDVPLHYQLPSRL
jgi:hypothetical protein